MSDTPRHARPAHGHPAGGPHDAAAVVSGARCRPRGLDPWPSRHARAQPRRARPGPSLGGSRVATGDGRGGRARRASAGDGAHTLIVPWDSTVVLLEVPTREACERLASVGQWSGNRVVAVGYDCIPIVSAGLVPLAEPSRFVHYLTAVKYMSAVAGISISATSEFRGFAQMLPAQGLVGPRVTECALPVDATGIRPREAAGSTTEPLVLCVGSREPRKNQLAVLWAAEVLWREGLNFRLRFVGAGGWGSEFPRAVRRARRAGRPVEVLTAISEDELDESYRTARFTVFVSVHEGYGLPVAESLARSTPALASNYGSIREIGVGGGTLLVDPRDDEQIVDGMRRMLVDDALIRELSAQIARRPQRTWDDYAAELWEVLGWPMPMPAQVRRQARPVLEVRIGAGRISADIDRLGHHRRRAVRDRLRSILTALESRPGDSGGDRDSDRDRRRRRR